MDIREIRWKIVLKMRKDLDMTTLSCGELVHMRIHMIDLKGNPFPLSLSVVALQNVGYGVRYSHSFPAFTRDSIPPVCFEKI